MDRPYLKYVAWLRGRMHFNLSSMLMGSALEIMTSLTDEGMTTNQIYGVRFLIEASAALVDATTGPVEFGNRQGGVQ